MSYIAAKKKGILIPSGPSSAPRKLHLFATATDACDNGLHLLVPICSVVPGRFHDPTCIIQPGSNSHPFIKHESYVEYRLIKQDHGTHIGKCVDGWLWRMSDAFPDALMNDIVLGIQNSKFTPRWAKEYLRKWPKG